MTEQKEKIKVYLAILNNGTLRRELVWNILPMMRRTKGVELTWENPGLTWANPISSNRNMITKRFLKTDCDYLLMIDDDVVPHHNPCELVHADKDIIGCPAKVRSKGQIMVWTAYVPHASGNKYSAVDIDAVDDVIDLLDVAIVGTGCILIKRKVLENLKAPFHSEFNEDGIQEYGTDFAFCRKAKKAGFNIYTTPQRRCEHYKKGGLNDAYAWDEISGYNTANAAYKMAWGGKAVTQKDWLFIRRVIKYLQPKRILEFGANLSSLLMSEICEVICYETDLQIKEHIESKCIEKNNLTIRLWDGKTCPEDIRLGNTYSQFDLVFVNGPKDLVEDGIGRDASINIASKVSDNIILHDAGRYEENELQREHLRCIFKLMQRSGDHQDRCHYWRKRKSPATIGNLTEVI